MTTTYRDYEFTPSAKLIVGDRQGRVHGLRLADALYDSYDSFGTPGQVLTVELGKPRWKDTADVVDTLYTGDNVLTGHRTVDCAGWNLSFGTTDPAKKAGTISLYSSVSHVVNTATLTSTSTTTGTYQVNANSAGAHTLYINATNSGAGTANIMLDAKTRVDIDAIYMGVNAETTFTGGMTFFNYLIQTPGVVVTDPRMVFVGAMPASFSGAAINNVWLSQSTNLITGAAANNVYIGATVNCTSTSSSNVAIGHNCSVSGGNSRVAVGSTAAATGGSGVAIGAGATASGTSSTGLGWSATASATGATAIGHSATCSTTGSIQLNVSNVSGTATAKFRTQVFADESWIGGGTTTASIDNSGNIFRTPSDSRLKKDILDLPIADSLALVKGVQPKSFKWKTDLQDKLGRGTRAGLIAQEVEAVTPSLVYNEAFFEKDEAEISAIDTDPTLDEETKKTRKIPHIRKFKGIKESELVFHLFNVIKNLVTRIEKLEAT